MKDPRDPAQPHPAAPTPAPARLLDDSIALGTPPPSEPADAQGADVPLTPGDRLVVEAQLGAGGMGKVYRARDERLRRTVALKLLRAAGPAQERRFLREAQAQARVDHENVCPIYEVGRFAGGPFDGEPFIAMQHIAGETLRRAAPLLSLAEKVEVLRKAALGVHAAHTKGLIHRDLKPDNVLVVRTDDGGVKPYVTDFGLARDLEAPGNTYSGEVLGTPEYMAPEQARGELARIDARTDVYALGALLYELLAGAPPFGRGPIAETLHKAVHEAPAPLAKVAKGAPRDLCAVAMKCLEKDPARRYGSARALADDLARWQRGDEVLARPRSVLRRLFGARSRGPSLVAVAFLLALIVGAALAALRPAPQPPLSQAITVAVADLDNETGEARLADLSGMLTTSLRRGRGLSVLTRSRMRDLLREQGLADEGRIDEPRGRALARRAGAAALVVGSVRREGAGYSISLRAVAPASGSALFALEEHSRSPAEIPQAVDRLSERVRLALRPAGALPADE